MSKAGDLYDYKAGQQCTHQDTQRPAWLRAPAAQAGADPVCVFCRSAWAVNKPKPRAETTKKGRKRKPSTVVSLLDVSQVRPWPGLWLGFAFYTL